MEYPPKESDVLGIIPGAETAELTGSERIEERIHAIENRLAKTRESGTEADISPATEEKITKKASLLKKLAKYASIGMALYGAAEYADYQATRNSIHVEKKTDGTL